MMKVVQLLLFALVASVVNGAQAIKFSVGYVPFAQKKSLSIERVQQIGHQLYTTPDLPSYRVILLNADNLSDKGDIADNSWIHVYDTQGLWSVTPNSDLISFVQNTGANQNLASTKFQIRLNGDSYSLATAENVQIVVGAYDDSQKGFRIVAQDFDNNSQLDAGLNFVAADQVTTREPTAFPTAAPIPQDPAPTRIRFGDIFMARTFENWIQPDNLNSDSFVGYSTSSSTQYRIRFLNPKNLGSTDFIQARDPVVIQDNFGGRFWAVTAAGVDIVTVSNPSNLDSEFIMAHGNGDGSSGFVQAPYLGIGLLPKLGLGVGNQNLIVKSVSDPYMPGFSGVRIFRDNDGPDFPPLPTQKPTEAPTPLPPGETNKPTASPTKSPSKSSTDNGTKTPTSAPSMAIDEYCYPIPGNGACRHVLENGQSLPTEQHSCEGKCSIQDCREACTAAKQGGVLGCTGFQYNKDGRCLILTGPIHPSSLHVPFNAPDDYMEACYRCPSAQQATLPPNPDNTRPPTFPEEAICKFVGDMGNCLLDGTKVVSEGVQFECSGSDFGGLFGACSLQECRQACIVKEGACHGFQRNAQTGECFLMLEPIDENNVVFANNQLCYWCNNSARANLNNNDGGAPNTGSAARATVYSLPLVIVGFVTFANR